MAIVKVRKHVVFLKEECDVSIRRPHKRVKFLLKRGHIYTENTYRCHFTEGREGHVYTEGKLLVQKWDISILRLRKGITLLKEKGKSIFWVRKDDTLLRKIGTCFQ
jgi:hypothetical protein